MTVEQLKAFLAELGDTATQVANTLHMRGVRGAQGQPQTCVVAEAVRQHWPKANASASTASVALSGRDFAIVVASPPPVANFILEFDRGLHPDLTESATL